MIRYLIFWDIKKLETPRISLLFTVGKESQREINQTGFFSGNMTRIRCCSQMVLLTVLSDGVRG